ncbi:DUF2306 domain-containing protein [soil metagenome]
MTHASPTSTQARVQPSGRAAVSLRTFIVPMVAGAGVIGFLSWMLVGGAGAHPVAVRLHAPNFALLAQAPALIRLHIAAAVMAFLIGSVILIGVKGTTLHKSLGWAWMAAMMTTAVSSLWIKTINPDHWSYIHFLSGWVIIAVPMGLVAIKRRNVRMHARMMTSIFVGGLVIAGAFTFVPGRLMFQVFFG